MTVTSGGTPAGSDAGTDTDTTLDIEDLTLEGLDELDGVIDDDDLPGKDPGLELSDEVDPGCTPDVPVVPAQGGRS